MHTFTNAAANFMQSELIINVTCLHHIFVCAFRLILCVVDFVTRPMSIGQLWVEARILNVVWEREQTLIGFTFVSHARPRRCREYATRRWSGCQAQRFQGRIPAFIFTRCCWLFVKSSKVEKLFTKFFLCIHSKPTVSRKCLHIFAPNILTQPRKRACCVVALKHACFREVM